MARKSLAKERLLITKRNWLKVCYRPRLCENRSPRRRIKRFFLARSEQRRISLREGSKSGFLVVRVGTAKPLRAGEWKIILARSQALEFSHSLNPLWTFIANEGSTWARYARSGRGLIPSERQT